MASTGSGVALLLALIAGLVLGAAAAAWIARRSQRLALDAALASAGAEARTHVATSEARLAARTAEAEALARRLERAEAEAHASRDALGVARIAQATLEAELRDERERAAEKLDLFAQARDQFSEHFRTLAGDALEANRKRMVEQHEGGLSQLLKPLGDRLASFEKKVEETYDKEAQQRFSLRQEVLNLQQATTRITEDANNLTRALKGESRTRGNWGEVILERVLERSGLVRGAEYVVQHSLRGHEDEGSGLLRPDVVIRLPDNKHVVIDSKVSLVAYDRYHAAIEEAARGKHGKQHVDSLRDHVKSLASKNYQSGQGLDAPDFVALFVPIEPAFGLACALDEELFLDAWDLKVVIVTPSTLLAMLTTVQSLWQRDKQTRNAIEIAEQSGRLYDQLVRIVETMKDVGKKLKGAHESFETFEKQLSEGKGNLVGRVQNIRKLGAKANKQLPPALVERATAHETGLDSDAQDADDDADPQAARAGAQLTLVPPAADSEAG